MMRCNKFFQIEVLVVCLLSVFCGVSFGNSEADVFVTSYLQKCSTATKPGPGQLKDKISIFAARGEYEPVTVSVRAKTDLKWVSVMLTDDLVSKTGGTIPKSAVDIRLVDPFEERTKKKVESYLLSQKSVDISADITRRFWITIHVPADAKPGVYRSKLLVSKPVTRLGPDLGKPDSIETLDYEVNVLPIKLLSAKETGMAFLMFHNTGYYSKEFVTEEYQTKVFEDMREHGMTTTTIYVIPVVDGKFTLTKDKVTESEKNLSFERTMRMLKKTDLVAPGLPVIWVWGGAYGSEVWKGVIDEGRKKDWPELVFYVSDEPGDPERAKGVRDAMKRVRAFHEQNPDYKFRVTTGLGSSRGIQTVGHYYDLWIACMAQRIGETGVIADAKMQNKELWFYDCMMAPVDAEMDRYFFGVWAWVSGVKGCTHWTYYAQPHLSYIYPAKNEIIPTIGWEGIREGIDDYRYLATLKQLVEKAKAAGKADLTKGAEEIFEDVKKMVTMDNYGKAYIDAAYDPASNAGAEQGGAYNRKRVEPDLAIDAYDNMRLKVSKEIEKITAAMSAKKR